MNSFDLPQVFPRKGHVNNFQLFCNEKNHCMSNSFQVVENIDVAMLVDDMCFVLSWNKQKRLQQIFLL